MAKDISEITKSSAQVALTVGGQTKSLDSWLGAITSRVEFVTNIAALTALTKASLSDGDARMVSGQSTPGDGLAGRYFWDSASGITADGCYSVASDEGGNGRWILDAENVDVRKLLAKADDLQNNTTNFQEAHDLASYLGTAVVVPFDHRGNAYRINSTVTIKAPMIGQNSADGRIELKGRMSNGTPMFQLLSGEKLQLQNLHFQMSFGEGACVKLGDATADTAATRGMASNCWFRGNLNNTIGVHLSRGWIFSFHGCDFRLCGYGFHGEEAINAVSFHGTNFEDNLTGARIDNAAAVAFFGGAMEGNQNYGAEITGAGLIRAVIFDSMYFEGSGSNQPVHLRIGGSGPVEKVYMRGCTLHGSAAAVDAPKIELVDVDTFVIDEATTLRCFVSIGAGCKNVDIRAEQKYGTSQTYFLSHAASAGNCGVAGKVLKNAFPNPHFKGGWRGFPSTTLSNCTVAEETSVVRSAGTSLAVTAAATVTEASAKFDLPTDIISSWRGRRVFAGIWIYIPTGVASTVNPFLALEITIDSTQIISTAPKQDTYVSDRWVFALTQFEVPVFGTFTSPKCSLFLTRSGSVNSSDVVYFSDGFIGPCDDVAKIMGGDFVIDERIAEWHGKNITTFGTSEPSDSDVYAEVGDVWLNPAPIGGGHRGKICITAGAPGTWNNFGPIVS